MLILELELGEVQQAMVGQLLSLLWNNIAEEVLPDAFENLSINQEMPQNKSSVQILESQCLSSIYWFPKFNLFLCINYGWPRQL